MMVLYGECKDISLDIETLSTYRNAVVLSIGAVGFDLNTGYLAGDFEVNIDPEDAIRHGLVTDNGTINWWLQQSDAAWEHLMNNEVSLEEACDKFSDFVKQFPKGSHLWGNGVGFDNMLVRDMYTAAKKKYPIHWSKDMDMRTIVRLYKEKVNHKNISVAFKGVKHCALDDARHQAKLICETWRHLKY